MFRYKIVTLLLPALVVASGSNETSAVDCDFRTVRRWVEAAAAAPAEQKGLFHARVTSSGGIDVEWQLDYDLYPCIDRFDFAFTDNGFAGRNEAPRACCRFQVFYGTEEFPLYPNFEGIKNETTFQDGHERQHSQLTNSEVFRAAESTPLAGPIPITVAVGVVPKNSPYHVLFGMSTVTLVPCLDEMSEDGGLRYVQRGEIEFQQLSYDVGKETAVVEINWENVMAGATCNPRVRDVETYKLVYWQPGDWGEYDRFKAHTTKVIPSSQSKATFEVNLDQEYQVQLFAVDALTGKTLSLGHRSFRTKNCAKGLDRFPSIEFGEYEWNGEEAMSKVEVKFSSTGPGGFHPENDFCFKSLAIAYWPESRRIQGPFGMELTPNFKPGQTSVQIEVPPNVNMAFKLVAFMAGEREGEEKLIELRDNRAKSFKATAAGMCSKDMENRPRLEGTPGISVSGSERWYQISVTWDNMKLTNQDCMVGYFVRVWQMRFDGQMATENYYENYLWEKAIAEMNETSIVVNVGWKKIYQRYTVHAQVVPTVIGDNYMEHSDRNSKIDGVYMTSPETYGTKVAVWKEEEH